MPFYIKYNVIQSINRIDRLIDIRKIDRLSYWLSAEASSYHWPPCCQASQLLKNGICPLQVMIIKFPFKRNGLPCCEDEPGSDKIALKWKSSIWIFWYLRYVFVLYANERYTNLYSNKLKCINFTKYKSKDKSFPFN